MYNEKNNRELTNLGPLAQQVQSGSLIKIRFLVQIQEGPTTFLDDQTLNDNWDIEIAHFLVR